MHSSIVLMVMTRCAALAALTFALTLTPSLSGGDLAEARAVKPKSCDQKYWDCVGRCNNKYNPTNETKGKAIDAAGNCVKRTCDPQFRNCLAARKKPTMSEQPLQPLTPPGTPAPPTKVSPKAPVGGAVGTKP